MKEKIFNDSANHLQTLISFSIKNFLDKDDDFKNKHYKLLKDESLQDNVEAQYQGAENYYSRDKIKATSVISQLLNNKRKYSDKTVKLISENLKIEPSVLIFGVSETKIYEEYIRMYFPSLFIDAFLSDKYFSKTFSVLMSVSSISELFLEHNINEYTPRFKRDEFIQDTQLFLMIANDIIPKIINTKINGETFFEKYYSFIQDINLPLRNLDKTQDKIFNFLCENYFPYLLPNLGVSYSLLKYSLLKLRKQCLQDGVEFDDYHLTDKTKILVKISELLELLDENYKFLF